VQQFAPVVVALVFVVLLVFQTRITARYDYQRAACAETFSLTPLAARLPRIALEAASGCGARAAVTVRGQCPCRRAKGSSQPTRTELTLRGAPASPCLSASFKERE
jgi:hypothetical protein